MRYRRAQSQRAWSPRSWSEESGLIRSTKHTRNTSQSSIYGALLSRAFPDNVACSGVDDSDDEIESKRRSLAIDKYLDIEREARKRRLNITAIGSCDQNRILWKQMRLRARPLSQGEQSALSTDVRKTVLSMAVKCLKVALEQLEGSDSPSVNSKEDLAVRIRESLEAIVPCVGPDEPKAADLILQIAQDPEFETQLEAQLVNFLALQQQVLDDKCPSFLACTCTNDHDILRVLRRVFSPGYEPTEHDWFHFERRRHGTFVRETQIKEGDKVFNFIDLYNRAERKKWIHVFEELAALVFVADPSTYDPFSEEHYRPFDETLLSFDSIVNSSIFKTTPTLLVLSNTDTFLKKLETRPLSQVYPEYKGTNDQTALDFMTQKFKSVNRSGKDIHIYHSRGPGVDNQYEFLDVLENAIKGQPSFDSGKRKNGLSFLRS